MFQRASTIFRPVLCRAFSSGATVPNVAAKARSRRILYISAAVFGLGAGGLLLANSFQDSLMFYMTPQQAMEADPPVAPNKKLRLGGLVVPGSVSHDKKSMSIQFDVSDYSAYSIRVSYMGMLPDLFREGQGVVAEGFLDKSTSSFRATEVLAKHDENYAPKGIKESMESNRNRAESKI
ncbi:mitochondrial cytochrome c-type biogenesis protein CcmE [Andalucia godoyi]|uniref:Mitochondrial cytochrome c-type biogenesis protein CcmE n=1 Tax=Andalucia godoyi TaxID=505711 RepID=A0A8K0F0P7_ANDGO|nr:mitochondrial cytochrome c-type biogenesis protein CcmE [Andalucia godoyi]|eukprot:ANDGO_06919.mRNA.1 mitochondrial cytochrome c-type biogenesis protein CcmE